MPEKTDSVQSIARAALLLRTLATFEFMGASLLQISTLTQLPKATVHRLLAALIDQRLVERPAGTRLYRLGTDIYAFGTPVRDAFNLQQQCRPSLERLASATQATVYLGVRSGYDMLCLDKIAGQAHNASNLLELHDRWPLGIGSFSLALLAFLPAREIGDVIEFNQRRISDEDTLTFEHIHASITKTRRNGYAKRTTRFAKGWAGVAAPVFDERKYPIASLCVVAQASAMNASTMAVLATQLKREAALITQLYEGTRLQQQQQERWRLAVRGAKTARRPQ